MNAVVPPRITPEHRAAHAVRVKAAALADRITEEHYRRRPELERRYGPPGRRRCLEDALFHLHFLAGSVEFGNPAIFADYVGWLARLLARLHIPVSDVADNVKVMGDVIRSETPGEMYALIRPHFHAALKRLDTLGDPLADQSDAMSRIPKG